MNRVTKAERIAGHTVHYISDNDIFEIYACPGKITGFPILCLSAYEDTGLEPEEIERILDSYGRGMTLRTENAQRLEIIKEIPIDRLRELAQAYRLLGNTVYEPNKRGFVSTYKVISVHLSECSILVGWDLLDGIYSNLNGFEISALGKTVFLTREAAEAALDAMGGENNA